MVTRFEDGTFKNGDIIDVVEEADSAENLIIKED